MKTIEQIQERAEQIAHSQFHCDDGQPWEIFENWPEQQLAEEVEMLTDAIASAMAWAQKSDLQTKTNGYLQTKINEYLQTKTNEYLETLDDEEKDEWYATERRFAAVSLHEFLEFLNKPEKPEDMYGTETPPPEYPYYVD